MVMRTKKGNQAVTIRFALKKILAIHFIAIRKGGRYDWILDNNILILVSDCSEQKYVVVQVRLYFICVDKYI
jgi:hypothetical protein